MKVDPQQLTQLAQHVLGYSTDVAREWQDAQGPLQVDAGAAGNSAAGPSLVAAHGVCADAADVAVGRLVATLEQTMDGLYACAFDLTDTDEDQAAKFRGELPFALFVPADVAS